MKKCKDCHSVKPKIEFYGAQGECKECTKKRVSAYSKTERGKAVDRRRNQKPGRKEWQRKHSKLMRKKHWKQRRARQIFWNKFRSGSIPKLPCNACGTTEIVEAHHPDYDKPLDVMWLCSLHHKEWHRNNISKGIEPPKMQGKYK